MRWIAPTLLFLAACGKPPAAPPSPPPKPERLTLGAAFPASTKTTLAGERLSFGTGSGRPTIVLFWATWSAPDVKLLARVAEMGRTRPGLLVVAVSIDDEPRGVAETAKKYGFDGPVVWDEDHALVRRTEIDTDPTAFVLDAAGRVKLIVRGYHGGDDESDMNDALDSVLHVAPHAR